MAFRLGRIRPDVSARRLMLGPYLSPSLPVPPRVEHWSSGEAYRCMRQVYANDKLGDCTAAGAGHILGLWRADARNGAPIPTSDDVVKFYSATTGYDPSDPSTDRGGDETTVLNAWRDTGFFADGSGKIAGWANVEPANEIQVKQAIWLFENVYFGVELPDAWISPFPDANGFMWGEAGEPNPSNGHCFAGLGYDDNGVIINSWGMMGTITWAAVAKYCAAPNGELHVALSEDALNRASGKAPNGFDLAALKADLAAFR